jgi:hypothetical protein
MFKPFGDGMLAVDGDDDDGGVTSRPLVPKQQHSAIGTPGAGALAQYTTTDKHAMVLRFVVEDEVSCNVGGAWRTGRVRCVWWQEPSWPADRWAPYQVELSDGTVIYAPMDDDKAIRRAAPSSAAIGAPPVVFDFAKAAQAGPGVVQQAVPPQHGFECPCCVDQGPDMDMMF